MSDYKFVTIWHFKSPVQPVWDQIYYSENWHEWWRGVESVTELEEGDNNGVGSLRRYVWKSAIPYRLTINMRVTKVEPLETLEGIASGELDGTGVWKFSQKGDITTVRYDWNIRTTKLWMNLFAPIARPPFKWNHNVVMRWGEEGLAKRLSVSSVDSSS